MKKALIIGINYKHTANELHGCINDAHNMEAYLKEKGFEIMLMTDDTPIKPTKANIIKYMKKLVKRATPTDTFFVHYSGHGSSVVDKNRDERDGKDETIVPLDLDLIIDDDLRKMLVDPLPKGAKLTALFDCCHSGTGLDLRYNYQLQSMDDKVSRYITDVDKHYSESKADVVLISGCEDPFYSADTVIDNQAQGAMTYAFLSTERLGKPLTYLALLKKLRRFMKDGGYSQVPQLSSGTFLDLNTVFNICK